jgi:hypothetical protein
MPGFDGEGRASIPAICLSVRGSMRSFCVIWRMLMPFTLLSMTASVPVALRISFQSLFRPGADIYETVSEGHQFDALYFSMLVFGCLIALLGLLVNSPAVIIGAMLISPLMGRSWRAVLR